MAKLHVSAKSGDPDQTQRSAASDLGLHCLPFSQLKVGRGWGLYTKTGWPYLAEGNLALGKPATQWRTTARNGFYWTADKGVDGCYERSDPSTSKCCSESTDNTEMHNFWRVNLKGQYEVEKVLIYDRGKAKDSMKKDTPFVNRALE